MTPGQAGFPLAACLECPTVLQFNIVATKSGTPATSESVDDYLKAILELSGAEESRVTTNALAERLRVRTPSVTGMLQKLALERPALVLYEKHHGVRLTAAGKRRAWELVRHHRLLELFLHDVLKYSWDEVHEEAERLEHFISERFEDRVAAILGDPEIDPHGHVIPQKYEAGVYRNEVPLARWPLPDAGGDQQRFRPQSRGPARTRTARPDSGCGAHGGAKKPGGVAGRPAGRWLGCDSRKPRSRRPDLCGARRGAARPYK